METRHSRPKLNIGFDSDNPVAVMLSNFAAASFLLDGVPCASTEGFIMAIMFPPEDPRHALALTLTGRAAKKLGRKAEREFVWWNGRKLPFRSPGHEALIERALRAKFEQNRLFMSALRSTVDVELIHEMGRPESPRTSLPKDVFCDILTRVRDRLLPRWPKGTAEEPLEVKVRPHGAGFRSWIEDEHGDDFWFGHGPTVAAAVAQTLEWPLLAHDRVHVAVMPLPA